jgi:hypothetical protein
MSNAQKRHAAWAQALYFLSVIVFFSSSSMLVNNYNYNRNPCMASLGLELMV